MSAIPPLPSPLLRCHESLRSAPARRRCWPPSRLAPPACPELHRPARTSRLQTTESQPSCCPHAPRIGITEQQLRIHDIACVRRLAVGRSCAVNQRELYQQLVVCRQRGRRGGRARSRSSRSTHRAFSRCLRSAAARPFFSRPGPDVRVMQP